MQRLALSAPAMLACLGLIAVAGASRGDGGFLPSPYLASIPDPPCDVVVTPANASLLLTQLNDPARRVFCVDPGDYRSFGQIYLYWWGSSSAPRYLRFNGPGATKAIQRSQRAVFEHLLISGSWWVIQGLAIQPRNPATIEYVSIAGADHVVLDGNLIDGAEQPASSSGLVQAAVVLKGTYGNPATHNTVQSNVIRNGNPSRQPIDYVGVLVSPAFQAGEDNDWNRILDNEISNWGDGIAIAGYTEDCSEPGRQHGTVIDGNDVFLRSGKYVDCATGQPDTAGECACAENGIDVKSDPGPDPAGWTRITNNRLWGFRPNSPAASCGGSGSLGQAITAGNLCPGHVFVASNHVADATIGIETIGPGWIVAGNLLHDLHASDGHVYETCAILTSPESSQVDVQFNTIVRADVPYEDASSDTDTRCNVVVDSPALKGAGYPRGAGHVTVDNWLYHSPAWNFGAGNPSYATVAESHDGNHCYWRRRWTSPEWVCVAAAETTPQSPHAGQIRDCDPAIGAAFGMPSVGWYSRSPSGCGIGAELAAVLAALRLRRVPRPRRATRGAVARAGATAEPARPAHAEPSRRSASDAAKRPAGSAVTVRGHWDG